MEKHSPTGAPATAPPTRIDAAGQERAELADRRVATADE
jgi:hypothetical protein